MRQSCFGSRSVVAVVPVVVVWLAAAGAARAADPQLVSFDETFTIVQKGDGGLEPYHHRIDPKPTEPKSWVTPINYSKGTAHIYLEVLKKPSQRKTILTICFDGEKAGYGCIDTEPYTDLGKFDTMSPMAEGGLFWQYNAIAWGKPRGQYHIVVKDPALGGTPGGKPPTDFVPTTVRLVMTIVPPGGTYVPPAPGSGAVDGGAAPDAAPAVDAGAAGGASGGSGGADGQGGSGAASGGSTGSSGSSGSSAGGSGGAASGGSGPTASGGTGGSTGPAAGPGGSSGSSGSKPKPAGSGGASAPDDGGTPSSGGCSMGGGVASSVPLAVALLLAAAAALRSRVRRRARARCRE
jgi:hypothetical protein